jgi:hypothetical protein
MFGPLPVIILPSYMLWGTCALFSTPGQNPSLVLGFSECFLCMFLALGHVGGTIYYRAIGTGISTEFESQLCLMLFSVHCAKYFLEKIYTGQNITKAEANWALALLGMFTWEYLHHSDSIIHQILVCWSIVDYLRCVITWSKFRGYMFAIRFAWFFSEAYVVVLLVPMFSSVVYLEQHDWWIIVYTIVLLVSVSPAMDRELRMILTDEIKPFRRPVFEMLRQHQHQAERNLLTFQEEDREEEEDQVMAFTPPPRPSDPIPLDVSQNLPEFTSDAPAGLQHSPRPIKPIVVPVAVQAPKSNGLDDLIWNTPMIPPLSATSGSSTKMDELDKLFRTAHV